MAKNANIRSDCIFITENGRIYVSGVGKGSGNQLPVLVLAFPDNLTDLTFGHNSPPLLPVHHDLRYA